MVWNEMPISCRSRVYYVTTTLSVFALMCLDLFLFSNAVKVWPLFHFNPCGSILLHVITAFTWDGAGKNLFLLLLRNVSLMLWNSLQELQLWVHHGPHQTHNSQIHSTRINIWRWTFLLRLVLFFLISACVRGGNVPTVDLILLIEKSLAGAVREHETSLNRPYFCVVRWWKSSCEYYFAYRCTINQYFEKHCPIYFGLHTHTHNL